MIQGNASISEESFNAIKNKNLFNFFKLMILDNIKRKCIIKRYTEVNVAFLLGGIGTLLIVKTGSGEWSGTCKCRITIVGHLLIPKVMRLLLAHLETSSKRRDSFFLEGAH